MLRFCCCVAAYAFASTATAAGRLVVEQAWIRTPPPAAMMLAGYAMLRNAGDAPLTIVGADSADFDGVSLHESSEENGVERMRALAEVSIAAGASARFTPGGKHFMLMRPKRQLSSGDSVKIHISTNTGEGVVAEFVVGDATP